MTNKAAVATHQGTFSGGGQDAGALGSLKERGLRTDPPADHMPPQSREVLVPDMLLSIYHNTPVTFRQQFGETQAAKDYEWNRLALSGKLGHELEIKASTVLVQTLRDRAVTADANKRPEVAYSLRAQAESVAETQAELIRVHEEKLAAARAVEEKERARKEGESRVAQEAAAGRLELARLGEAADSTQAEHKRLDAQFKKAPSVDLFAARAVAEQNWKNATDLLERRTEELRELIATADTNAELAELASLEREWKSFDVQECESKIAEAVKAAGELVRAELRSAIAKAETRATLAPRLRELRAKYGGTILASESPRSVVLKRLAHRVSKVDEYQVVQQHNGLLTLTMGLDGYALPAEERGHG